MKIDLASGHTVLADDADLELLLPHSWYLSRASGSDRLYASARIRGTPIKVRMHRLLMNPEPGMVVHHINNNGLDNRRCNLMVTTQQVNTRFAFVSHHCVHRHGDRWRTQPRDKTGKQISLGMYETEEQAKAVVQNWQYRKMLELEARGDQESLHLAAAIEQRLTA
jgi:hypothetical protein